MKKTIKKIQEFKDTGKKITSLTAYDYSTAKYFDQADVDIILIGDSLGQVILGYKSTTSVTMRDMEVFTAAAARGVQDALIIVDMPFLSYQASIKDAVENAGILVRAGANGVKIEGGSEYIIKTVEHLTQSGVPVMGHLGFTPQFINSIGGNFIAGKNLENTLEIMEQCKKLEQAGAFSIVLEMVPAECAKFISENLKIPTIGIGAGVHCDGQVLVSDDILGRFDGFSPKFARRYSNLKEIIFKSAQEYCSDVEARKFPNDAESFHLSDAEFEKLENYIKRMNGNETES